MAPKGALIKKTFPSYFNPVIGARA